MRDLDLAARILLYFVNLFTSSADDFRDNSKDILILVSTHVMKQRRDHVCGLGDVCACTH